MTEETHAVVAWDDLAPVTDRKGRFTLRPYQEEAVSAIYEAWRSRQVSVLVVKATGLGKTIVFAEVCLRWPQERGRILILAHKKELIEQAAEKVGRHLGETPEIEMANRRAGRHGLLSESNVVVSSVQTQNSRKVCGDCEGESCANCIKGHTYRMQRFDPMEFGLVIIDEGHHATAKTYRRILNWYRRNPNLKILLVTATPKRADKVGLHGVADVCCFEMDILDGINEGWLCPIEQQYVVVEGLDFSVVRTKTGNGESDFSDSSLADMMMGGVSQPVEGNDLSEEEVEILKKQERMLHAVADPTIKEAAGRPTLVFAVTKEHARRLAEVFSRDPGTTAAYVTDDTGDDDRANIISRFRDGDIQVLVGVGIFTEGFDAPHTAVVAVARPTKSESLYKQIVGRGTRPLEGVVDGPETAVLRRDAIAASAKPHMTVLDFVGNSGKHHLVSTADILAGKNLPHDIEAAVKKARKTGRAVNMQRLIDETKREREERERKQREEQRKRRERDEAERKRRAKLRAEAKYRTRTVDPFGQTSVPDRAQPAFRGGATDAQVYRLVKLGVRRETAMSYSMRQASSVIYSLSKKQESKPAVDTSGPPNANQQRVLERFGKTARTYAEAVQAIKEINQLDIARILKEKRT